MCLYEDTEAVSGKPYISIYFVLFVFKIRTANLFAKGCKLGIMRGNPEMKNFNPYPYLQKLLPLLRDVGF
jgi:hypothetical protein